ncbi:hypothetical protein BCR43DRAFT_487086 [Syncephalastrum racemosum]|uniref:Smr domain-containing protein n=1 Tax=Syncephalastrum racemosum TaxID=13706 RepID=A0A1X2HQ71_SYNRA|nr:hypothetical protein BCR43DRAFT_487086 [Syncephalastrum racemosum]
MGNSQSIDANKVEHVLRKGYSIYKAVKKQADQQNQDHSHQSHDNDTEAHLNDFHQATYHHVQEEHDDPEYTRLRALAHEEAEKRNACYERSQAAYHSGDGAGAKELSNQGHRHDEAMRKYNKQAADMVYYQKNHDRPSNEVDLHGLFVKEASEKAEEAIERCQREGADHLVIIVGKGLHSPGNIAKLKPAIINLVKKYNVSCEPNRPNPGCLYIEFGKGTGDLSWLDRLADHLGNKGSCAIM